jgi:hypothetical protein
MREEGDGARGPFYCQTPHPLAGSTLLRAFRGAKYRNSQDIMLNGSMAGTVRRKQRPFTALDDVPIPEFLNKLPHLHEQRPRGWTAMIDAAGARALHELRPGAWL